MASARRAVRLAAVVIGCGAGGARAEIVMPPPGAASCAGCHAAPGVDTPVPPIAGKAAAEIVAALAAYRADTTTGGIMNRIAKGFSAEESAAIAAWFANHKSTR